MTSEREPLWHKIPHLEITIGGYDLRCPVRIRKALYGDHKPETDRDGGYIYALPAGGRINSRGEIL